MSLIFLIGMPGAGKTHWGNRLSGELGYSFIDTDAAIEKEKKNSIANIFSNEGEEKFREAEEKILQDIIQNKHGNEIIACGGGTPCYRNNMDLMKSSGCVIYLKAG